MKYKIDTHTHSIASGHAYNTIREMAQEASMRGMEYLGITEHAPKMPGTCHDMYFLNLGVINRRQYGVRLLMGTELNIMDYKGRVDLTERIIKPMDIVIASMHTPCLKPGTMEENTSAVVYAMNNPLIHVIGHPDDARYPLDYEVVVKTARETGTLLEINNNSLNPNGPRVGAKDNDIKMLELCRKYNVPIVISSDAHTAEKIGDFTNAQALIDELDFPEELIVNRDFKELNRFINVEE